MLLLDPAQPAAVAETRLLHASLPGEPSWLVVSRVTDKWREKAYRVEDAARVLGTLEGSPDTYVSQATFITGKRDMKLAQTLRCAFLDLDLYNVGMIADDATVTAILRHARICGIPEPSLVMGSGRGLYAKWVFDTPITSTLLPQWRALQSTLIDLFREFGVDPKVRDAARVLRVASSLNTKSGTRVRVLHDGGTTVSFSQLCEQVGRVAIPQFEKAGRAGGQTADKAAATQRTRAAQLLAVPEASDLGQLEQYSARREPIMMRQFTERSLNWARFLDMRDLAFARGGFARGSRDIFLTSMIACLAHSGIVTPSNFWGEVQQLLAAFPHSEDFDPLNDKSLSTLQARIEAAHRGEFVEFRGALMSPIYTPSNDYLLDVLQVTPDEEMRLRTIISGQERQRRADMKVPGRAERRQARVEGRVAAQQLAAGGASAVEIADALGKSRATVYRWLSDARKTAPVTAAPTAEGQAITEQPQQVAPAVEMRGRRSPYAQRRQALAFGVRSPIPPVRKAAYVEEGAQPGPLPQSPQPPLASHELERRIRKTAGFAPVMTCDQAQAWVAERLEQIGARARQEASRRREAEQESAEQVKLRLQMRVARLSAHTREHLQDAVGPVAAGAAARGQPCAPPPKVAPDDGAGGPESHLWPAALRSLVEQRKELAAARARSAQRIERMREHLAKKELS